jgi:hypothetical protein
MLNQQGKIRKFEMLSIFGNNPMNLAATVMPQSSKGMSNVMRAWGPVGEYMTDSMQRTILFWDVLRQRSDPHAGYGPGIGGFKADSELGVAMNAGHPCYFVGFTPDPMPGQTIEDIMHAEAIFLEKIIQLHPDAAGIVIGARVPIILTSRADSVIARLASCAVAALVAEAWRENASKAVLA